MAKGTFIGREQWLTELGELTERHRLITITGPPGTGKTALARKFCEQSSGVHCFCDLAGIGQLEVFLERVSTVLDVPLGDDASVEQAVSRLARALQSGPDLLILDQIDRLLHAREVVGRWLDEDPDLTIVATSREHFNHPLEFTMELPPLTSEEAAELFRQRAAVDAGVPDDDIRELVESLDNLPLAVELAAARAGVLAPRDMLSRLDERMRLLRSKSRSNLALEAVIDASWDALSDDERHAFVQCSAFASDFTPDAAEHVLQSPDGEDPLWVLDMLDSLRKKSLLVGRLDEEGRRIFHLLSSLRAYASSRSRRDETSHLSTLRRHAVYFVGLGEQLREPWIAGTDSHARRILPKSIPELRIVIDRVSDHEPMLAARAALLVYDVATRLGPLFAAEPLLRSMRERVSPDSGLYSKLTAALATSLVRRGGRQEASDILDAAHDGESEELLLARARVRRICGDAPAAIQSADLLVERARKTESFRHLALGLGELGLARGFEDDVAVARLEESASLLRKLGYARDEAAVLVALGAVHQARGALTKARIRYERAQELAREADDHRAAAAALGNLGLVEHYQLRVDRAISHFKESMERFEAVGDFQAAATMQGNLGSALLDLGELEEARDHLEAARAVHLREGNDRSFGVVTLNLGVLEHAEGRVTPAREGYREARTVFDRVGAADMTAMLSFYEALLDWEQQEPEALMERADDAMTVAPHWAAAMLALMAATAEAEQADDRWRDVDELLVRGVPAFVEELVSTLRHPHRAGDGAWAGTRLAVRSMVPSAAGDSPTIDEKPTVVVARDGSWFRRGEGELIDLKRRSNIKRLLLAFMDALETSPGESLTAYDLLAVGWPEVDVAPDVGVRRVYTAINTLRRMGLDEDLVTDDVGYHLRPGTTLRRVEPDAIDKLKA